MKKMLALTVAVLILFSSAALADEIRFLGIPWLSSVETVTEKMAEMLPGEAPEGSFDTDCYVDRTWFTGGDGLDHVPVYMLEYNGLYDVAGMKVDRVRLWFVPEGAGGTFSGERTEGYMLVHAEYRFLDEENTSLREECRRLAEKLKSIYGEPAASLEGGAAGDNYGADYDGCLWESGNDTLVRLYYTSTSYRNGGTDRSLTISYGYGSREFFAEKTGLAPGEADVGPVNGL